MRNILTNAGMQKRLKKLSNAREAMLKNVDNLHVKLQKGNSKTGSKCYTVSLLPIIDCSNCDKCSKDCYDLRNDMIYPAVIEDRAKNSAIHKTNPERFWDEIDKGIKKSHVTELRINVGGDLSNDDFKYVAKVGRSNPETMIVFFTKNYTGINNFLNNHRFPKNVRPIMSRWKGMEMDNPYNLPCSHVLYEDGKTTAPFYGSYYCGGNCTECATKGEGCWTLKKGEHVIFNAH